MNAQVQRTAQQRIRGPNLAVFIKRADGLPFEEGLAKANAENRVIASNKRLSRALVDTHEWQSIIEVFACWSGTMTAYVEPNIVFDEKLLLVINDDTLEKLAGTRYFVEYLDSKTGKHWLFPVHPDYLGHQNAILVAEHPNYTLQADGNRIITLPAGMSLKQAVDLVENFPANNGWYKGDPNHDIPILTWQEGPRKNLQRIARRVGPAGRVCSDYNFFGRQDVGLFYGPSDDHGMAVEASEASV